MSISQSDKARRFLELHVPGRPLLMPNPWDPGSAKVLAASGFEALATTSMGYAFSLGKLDTTVGRDEMLAHLASLAAATSLPVNADLENGYGDDPHTVAETIRLAAAARLLDELVIIAPAGDDGAAQALAAEVGAAITTVAGPTGIPDAFAAVLG